VSKLAGPAAAGFPITRRLPPRFRSTQAPNRRRPSRLRIGDCPAYQMLAASNARKEETPAAVSAILFRFSRSPNLKPKAQTLNTKNHRLRRSQHGLPLKPNPKAGAAAPPPSPPPPRTRSSSPCPSPHRRGGRNNSTGYSSYSSFEFQTRKMQLASLYRFPAGQTLERFRRRSISARRKLLLQPPNR
jgi:hypothetical protein